MNPGDLVIRKIPKDFEYASYYERQNSIEQRRRNGTGLVLSVHMAGRPPHRCASVYYAKTNSIYDIAQSLLEVISEAK